MHTYLDASLVAAFVLIYGLFSCRVAKTVLTGPIIFCCFGWLMGSGGLGWIDLSLSSELVKVLAELTLMMVLFTDSSRIDLRLLRHNVGSPLRLLGIGLPLTIAAGFGVGILLFPDMNLWVVAILSTILAPTDAALGEAVVDHEEIPLRVRQVLNVESGLNDGICVPILSVLIAGALAQVETSPFVIAFEAIGYAVAMGLVVAYLGAKLVDWATHRGWMSAPFRRIAMIAIPLVVYCSAQMVGGSGFIASFIAGITVGTTLTRCDEDQFEAAQDASDLLSLMTWVVFGGAFVPLAFSHLTWWIVLYSVLSLTLVRMIPVALSLIGARFQWRTIGLIGWFGPRGLASVVFSVMVVDQMGIAGRFEIGAVVTWTVLLSIFVHGLTANWLAKLYGTKCGGFPADGPERAFVSPVRTRRKHVPG